MKNLIFIPENGNSENTLYKILFIVSIILTLGLSAPVGFHFYYDTIYLNHYVKNRSTLIDLIHEGLIDIRRTNQVGPNVEEFMFEYNNITYRIWKWDSLLHGTESGLTLAWPGESDAIGLFASTRKEKKKVKYLIDLLNNIKHA